MWTYRQHDGELLHDGQFEGTGYSGTGAGRNNHTMQDVPDVGPIPQGKYAIGPAYQDDHLGPYVMQLDPLPGANTFGRSLFRIHGDNARHDASHGGIILGPSIRRLVAASPDRLMEVEERISRLSGLRAELIAMLDSHQHGRVADCRIIEVLSDPALAVPESERQDLG